MLYNHMCDGEFDCKDGSDEDECPVQCESGEETTQQHSHLCTFTCSENVKFRVLNSCFIVNIPSICSQVSFNVHMVRSALRIGRCVTVWLSVRIARMKSTALRRNALIVVTKTAASQNPSSVMETQTVRMAAMRPAVVGV